ncbi:MAG: hypothetical protein EXS37_18500 [Opitutus sp.]|nr:hypothetical protein [Opitutus sp.]
MTPLPVLAGVFEIMAVSNSFSEFGVASAILLAVIGMVLHWRMPQHRMSMEERMKDGDISEDEARRRIRFYAWGAPVATILGIGMLVLVLFDLG